MVDEDSEKGRGQDDGDTKGRTVFGIGLPASVQAATRGGAAPAKAPPVASPAPPVARPAPPVAKAPPQVNAAAVRQQVSEESATVEDIRALQRPDDARAPVEEKRTIVGLPGQFGAAPIAATPRAPAPDATMIDVRAAAASGARQRDTGEFAATRSDVHAATRPTRAISEPHEVHREIKAQIKLVAGRPIPGTRYKLLRWLGEGGMGVVYEAEHIDIERRVALKILRSELSQRTDTAQVFRDEARAAARAGSKNIVEIFDFGELPDGRLFFCMELLNGTDLANLIEDNLELPRQLAILRQTCKGLGAAHKAGIVHRDIKPENIILVAHEGRRDMVKIVDFGVSAMLSQDRSDGPIAGTPQYMAPEQINNTQFDGRLDVYALGCVMYEMLAGTTPFPDENLADVLLAHINRAPTRPSQAKPDRQIPKPIEDVVMRCLEKDPEARYRDMADLEAALCEAQIAMGVVTEWDDLPLPDVEPERRAALVSRMPSVHGDITPKKRWWIPVAAAVGAAAVTGVVLMIMGAPEITPEEQARIDELSKSAREAASLGRYVNPPEDGGATALVKVRALEAVEGAGEKLADERGLELRTEFSNQLLTIGDKFWEAEPTKNLSREYYTWALMFDGTNERALTRSARSKAEIADLAKRAEENKLSLSERATGELMVAMMEEDVVAREKRTKRVLAKSAKDAPLSTQAALLEATRGAGIAVKPEEVIGGGAQEPDKSPETGPSGKNGAGTTAEPVEPPPVEPPPVEPTADNPEPVKKTSKTGGGGGGKKKPEGEGDEAPLDAEVKRDPVKADELAGQGKSALSSGRRDEAEKLFNQAIGYDRRNAEALIGLSDIFFDRGSTEKAQKFAERAVNVAPNNGTYRIKLGDAYYSALRYRDALTQYEKAKELGEVKADQRIAKVKVKLGG